MTEVVKIARTMRSAAMSTNRLPKKACVVVAWIHGFMGTCVHVEVDVKSVSNGRLAS